MSPTRLFFPFLLLNRKLPAQIIKYTQKNNLNALERVLFIIIIRELFDILFSKRIKDRKLIVAGFKSPPPF